MPEPRRIIVVGGTGGLGTAIIATLLARGDRVLATGRGAARLGKLAAMGAATHAMDLGDRDCGAGLPAACDTALGGRLDGLVLAAGGLDPVGPTRTVDLDAVAAALDTHLVGVLRVIQACAPLLDAAPDPSVVLFSGGGATAPFPRYSAYAMAKVATVRLAENLAVEEPGWRVNSVAPGFVATGIHAATLELDRDVVGPYYEETQERLQRATPPEVGAGLVAFLLSEAAAGITGRLISAPWDPWAEPAGAAVLRSDDDFGKLRRIDAQRYFDHGAEGLRS